MDGSLALTEFLDSLVPELEFIKALPLDCGQDFFCISLNYSLASRLNIQKGFGYEAEAPPQWSAPDSSEAREYYSFARLGGLTTDRIDGNTDLIGAGEILCSE